MSTQSKSLHIPLPNGKKRVVVIGGGFAGIHITKELLKISGVQVVMIDRHNHHLFQPLLYQVATLGLDPDSIAEPLRKHFGNNPDFFFRLAKVLQIDAERNSLKTNLGEVDYDYLVIANGAKTNYFGNEANYKNAYPLKQLHQAVALRNQIIQTIEEAVTATNEEESRSCLTFVVVGAGPTGVEVSGAIAELRKHILPNDYPDLDLSLMRIVLLEGGGKVLPALSQQSGEKALQGLKELNIEVKLNSALKSYDGKVAVLGDGSTIPCRTLIWGAGVAGNVIPGLAPEMIERSRIIVDEFSRVKGLSNVFAIGDIAMMKTAAYPNGYPMVAPVAIQMGKLLGENFKNIFANKELKSFVYKDQGSMATIGRNRAVVDFTSKIKIGGPLAWMIWMFVHLLSITGFRNKLMISLNWFWRYLTYDRGNRVLVRNFESYLKKKSENQSDSI